MVGGESDRPRNPKVGFARSRRAGPIAPAGVDPFGLGHAQLGRNAGFAAFRSTDFRTAYPATDSAEAPNHRAASASPGTRLQCARYQPATGAVAAADRGSSRSRWHRPPAEAETAAGVDAAGAHATSMNH